MLQCTWLAAMCRSIASYISHRPSKSIVLSTVNIHFHENKLGEHATTVSTTPQPHRCRFSTFLHCSKKRRRHGMSLEPPEDAEDSALLGRTTVTWTKGWTAWILVMWLAASLTWIWFRQGPKLKAGAAGTQEAWLQNCTMFWSILEEAIQFVSLMNHEWFEHAQRLIAKRPHQYRPYFFIDHYKL